VVVVTVVVVVVVRPAHGSEPVDSQVVVSRKTPSIPAHSVAVVSSQTSAPVPPPTGGWQQANFVTCAGHPSASASHTLARSLVHALTPLRAVHRLAAVTMHRVRSLPSVLQHTVDPCRPQAERAAHFIASCISFFDSPLVRPSALIACVMHRT
jgi:hypothetical protein